MKTQEAAKLLSSLATALKNSSYETVEEFTEKRERRVDVQSVDVPRALTMLVALSSFDKLQWAQVIHEYDFPIEIRARDASRDIMGKLLTYLERNPDARKRLSTTTPKSRSQNSPELASALESLLKS